MTPYYQDDAVTLDLAAIRAKCDAYDDLLDEDEIRVLLDYTEWLLGELKALDLKWQFEHELALGQEAEIQSLDADIAQLHENLAASRASVAQFCRILEVDSDVEGWAKCVELLALSAPAVPPRWPNGERRRGYPAYEALPADPSAPVPQKP